MNNIRNIYSTHIIAKDELKNRWNDLNLKKEVELFLENDVPQFLQDSPKAYLARCIATPNFEFLKF